MNKDHEENEVYHFYCRLHYKSATKRAGKFGKLGTGMTEVSFVQIFAYFMVCSFKNSVRGCFKHFYFAILTNSKILTHETFHRHCLIFHYFISRHPF